MPLSLPIKKCSSQLIASRTSSAEGSEFTQIRCMVPAGKFRKLFFTTNAALAVLKGGILWVMSIMVRSGHEA
jgi:hypothetical protein